MVSCLFGRLGIALDTLPETNSSHPKIVNPERKVVIIPTIHFQVQTCCKFQGGYDETLEVLYSSTVLTSAAMPFKAPNVRWGSSGVSVQLRILKKTQRPDDVWINTRYNQPLGEIWVEIRK